MTDETPEREADEKRLAEIQRQIATWVEHRRLGNGAEADCWIGAEAFLSRLLGQARRERDEARAEVERLRKDTSPITDEEYAALIKPVWLKAKPSHEAQGIRSALSCDFDDPRIKGQWASDFIPEYVWDLVDIAAQRGIEHGIATHPAEPPAPPSDIEKAEG